MLENITYKGRGREMFCPKCGNGLPDGVKFCGKCGTRIEGKSNVTIECNSVKPKTDM